jgi:hypothetical protein
LAQLGAAGAGLATQTEPKAETSLFEEIGKRSGKFKQDLGSAIEMQDIDPTSPKAQSYRKLLEDQAKKLGYETPDFSAMSMKDLKDVDDSLFRLGQRQQERDIKIDQKGRDFLNRESELFKRDKSTEGYLLMQNAMSALDDYLKNPSPEKATALSYRFAKINDPSTGVKEGELKLFTASGSLFGRVKENIKNFADGKVSKEKAERFKDLIKNNYESYGEELKTKLSSTIQRGKQYGFDERDIVENVAGPQYYKNLYKGTDFEQTNVLNKYFGGNSQKLKEYANSYFNGNITSATNFLMDQSKK